MENWTEANLVKLSVKELKSLARKSNVNANSRKAELIKALLTNAKDTADKSETSYVETSRRMTRSRTSIWQTFDSTSDTGGESKAKLKDVEDSLNPGVKYDVGVKRSKKSRMRVAENLHTYDTSEMFPLVSSIQLASKPLLEITNKDIVKFEQDKPDEHRTVASSKRTKRTKVGNQNIKEVLTFNNTREKEVALCSTDANSEQNNCDLNSTFTVVEEGSATKNVDWDGKNRKQSGDKPKNNQGRNEAERIQETQQNYLSVAEHKNQPENPKRGKKRKPESPLKVERSFENSVIQCESFENSDSVLNTFGSDVLDHALVMSESTDTFNPKKGKGGNIHVPEKPTQNYQSNSQVVSKPSKTRRKKANEGIEDSWHSKTTQKVECSTISTEIIDQLPEVSDSEIVKIKNISASNEMILDDSKKRKRVNSPLSENSIGLLENNCSGTAQNTSKRKKGAQSHETNALSSTETTANDKPKRSNNNKREMALVKESSKPQEVTELTEMSSNISGFQRSSLRNGSTPNIQNESKVVNSNNTNDSGESIGLPVAMKRNSLNENNNDDKNLTQIDGQTGRKSVQSLIRSSTFILSDSGATGEPEEMPVPVSLRETTFILSKSDGRSPQRRSLRFSPGSAFEKKSTSNQNAGKLGKSIGNRIMQTSMTIRGNENSSNKLPGSAFKKTIGKSTPGSVFKKRPASKMPDFKKIHQQMFNNMESLSDNKKRQLDRAQVLIQSPIVPRCAMLSPKPKPPSPTKPAILGSSPLRKVNISKVKTPVASSPLATELKTPVESRRLAQKPVPSSVNRFGFRKPVKKEEARSIVGKKLPSVNIEKKKEQKRNMLKGVRMNKRFMLQMQMRQTVKD